MKKFATLALSLVLAFTVAGCNLVDSDDSNRVIAKINGVEILKSDYNELYNYWYYYLINYYSYSADQAAEYLESMKSDFLDQLVEEEITRQMAEKEGYLNYTDEDRTEAQKVIDDEREQYITNLVSTYTSALEGQTIKGKNEGESDEEYFKRIAQEQYYKQLETNGSTEEDMLKEQLQTAALTRFKEDKLSGVTVTDAAILSEYNTQVEEQKEKITTAAEFVSAYKNNTYSTLVYYYPGYSLVMHILVPFDEDTVSALQELNSKLEDYQSDLDDAKADLEEETDADAIAKLKETIATAEAGVKETQQAYDDALDKAKGSIQEKTDSVYSAVKDGDEATFIEQMIANTSDTGMKTEEAAKKGYLVGEGDGLVPEFSSAAQALTEAGQVSEPVASYYGYHIIRKIKNLPDGKAEFDDVKEELKTSLVEKEKETQWSALVDGWLADATVKKYTNRL